MGVWLMNEKDAPLPLPFTKCAFLGATGQREWIRFLPEQIRASDMTLLLEHIGVWLEIARKPMKGQTLRLQVYL